MPFYCTFLNSERFDTFSKTYKDLLNSNYTKEMLQTILPKSMLKDLQIYGVPLNLHQFHISASSFNVTNTVGMVKILSVFSGIQIYWYGPDHS
jgi:hypothetical protein